MTGTETQDEGRLIAGRYRLERRIGGGAMGLVWLAKDELLDRTVALKELVLPATLTAEEAEQARKRAAREARIAARLQHRYAITVFDVADDGGMPVLVMEYLPSQSLAEVLNARGPMPPAEVARIGAQAAEALAAAHEAGIVHRDVKPGNILLAEDGTAKITDFGISRAVDDGTLTGSGALAGTPAFLSPEAARGEKPTAASDVFSLGATLYAIVEGRFPYGDTDNQMALLYAAAAGRVAPPQQAGPLTELLGRMMSVAPADRPSMAEAAAELRKIASPAPAGERRRGVVLWLTAAAVVLVAAVVTTVLLVRNGGDGGTAAPPAPSSSAPAPTSSAQQPTSSTAQSSPATSPSTTTPPPPSPPASAPAGGAPTLDPVQFMREYYGRMPGGTDVGWSQLSPTMQGSMSRAYYVNYWTSMSSFRVVSGPELVGPNTVQSTLDFVQNGRHYHETHRVTLVNSGGRLLVEHDALV
ncbi:serine/threonine-protein kinase [Amycolatopsis sacchari]|uniref:non-specific serine/threonine protein kinase n=1 Tax=Amycolatopsis sacchari TaxID=115433 RepID=A0A1I3MGE2_9PSEU|nr:serine/threonine-protein kinase [Amycolatopsis sacchari]SFI96033.1 Serine/threonine protein kinase [Amycolatopsis sacchari]